MSLEALELKATAALMKAEADGLHVIALLLQGRILVENFLRGPPGVTADQCRAYMNRVDTVVFGDSPETVKGDSNA